MCRQRSRIPRALATMRVSRRNYAVQVARGASATRCGRHLGPGCARVEQLISLHVSPVQDTLDTHVVRGGRPAPQSVHARHAHRVPARLELRGARGAERNWSGRAPSAWNRNTLCIARCCASDAIGVPERGSMRLLHREAGLARAARLRHLVISERVAANGTFVIPLTLAGGVVGIVSPQPARPRAPLRPRSHRETRAQHSGQARWSLGAGKLRRAATASAPRDALRPIPAGEHGVRDWRPNAVPRPHTRSH